MVSAKSSLQSNDYIRRSKSSIVASAMKERNMSVQLVALSLLGVNNVFSEEEMV